jgi:hypothetical protein
LEEKMGSGLRWDKRRWAARKKREKARGEREAQGGVRGFSFSILF